MGRMQAGIILAGQQPNILNTLAQSTRAATLANANKRQNGLNALYQEHGSGLVNGDQNALNALAAQDPRQALQFQQAHRQNERQERRFAFDERAFDFRVRQFEAQADARQKAEAAEAARKDAFMLGSAQTPEEFDAIAIQIGEPDFVGGFDQKDMIVRKHMTAAELFERSKPQKPLSPVGKLKQDLRDGIITPEEFNAATQKSGIRVESDGKGGFTFVQGPGVAGDDPTDVTSPASPAAMIASIDGILNDPALDTSTGLLQWTQNIPGTAAKRFGARAAQLEGQAFLQAFESLKGGGHITEIEGQKATQAIGRLDTAQSPEDYRQALTELRDILQKGMDRKANAGKADQPKRLKYNLETGAFE